MTPSEDRVLNKLREEIARIIEPFYWRWLDVPGQEHAYAPGRQKTLAKADQIIAAWNRRADPLVEELRDDPRLHQAAYSLHQAGYHDLGEFIDGVREALALPVGGGSSGGRVQTSPDGLTDAQHSAAWREYCDTLRASVACYGRTLTTQEILSGLEAVTREALEEE